MISKALWVDYLTQNKLKVLSILLLAIVSSICTIILPLSIGKFSEIVFQEQTNKSRALELLGIYLPNSIKAFFIFFVSVMLVKFITTFLHSYYSSILGDSFIQKLRKLLIEYYLNRKKNSPRKKISPSALLPFTTEVKTVQRYIIKGVIGFTKDIILLILALYVLGYISIFLSVTIVLLLIIFYFLHRFLSKIFTPYYADNRNQQGKLISFIAKSFTNNFTDDSKLILDEYEALSCNALQKKRGYIVRKAFLSALVPFFLALLLLATMLTVLLASKQFIPSSSTILMYVLVLITIFPTIRNVLKIDTIWAEGNLAMGKFNRQLLDKFQKTSRK